MRYLLMTILSFIAVTTYGQVKKWTLEECMTYAVENNPRVSKQGAQNKIYNQDYLEAIGRLLPTIGAGTSTNFNFGRGLDASTNTYTDINSFSNNYSLSSSLVLFDGLANINRVKMQKASKLMGKQELQEVKDMVAYETMEAFFNVLYNSEIVKLSESQLQESALNLKQVKRMEELGVKGFPEVAEMAAKEAADNYKLTRFKNILTIEKIRLKEKMNFPIDENFEIADSVMTDLIVKSKEMALDFFDQSKSYLPKALAAELSFRAKTISYKATKGSLVPSLSVDGGYSTNFSRYMDGSEYTSFKDQIKGKRGRHIGLTLSIPILNGFSRSSNVRRSKAQMLIAQNERDQTLRTLYSEIEQAVADMNGQVDEYFQAKKQTEAMSIAHDVNQRKFTEGLISAIDLHISANRLIEARAEELNAKFKYELKNKMVDYYKGIPFIADNKQN